MNSARPLALKVVAVVFIATGVLACIEVIGSLAGGRISLNLGVLNLPCGFGLLRLSRGWRTYGLVMSVLTVLGVPLLLCLALPSRPTGFELKVFGRTVGPASQEMVAFMFGLLGAWWLWSLWTIQVLNSRPVKALFGAGGADAQSDDVNAGDDAAH